MKHSLIRRNLGASQGDAPEERCEGRWLDILLWLRGALESVESYIVRLLLLLHLLCLDLWLLGLGEEAFLSLLLRDLRLLLDVQLLICGSV